MPADAALRQTDHPCPFPENQQGHHKPEDFLGREQGVHAEDAPVKYIGSEETERNADTPCAGDVDHHDQLCVAATSDDATAEDHIFDLDWGIEREDDEERFPELPDRVIHTIDARIPARHQDECNGYDDRTQTAGIHDLLGFHIRIVVLLPAEPLPDEHARRGR